MRIGVVKDVEHPNAPYNQGVTNDEPFDALRVRVEFEGSDNCVEPKDAPWAFPLLPKTFQSVPKVGETVFVLYDGNRYGQRFYLGPIISQPQFNTFCDKHNATALFDSQRVRPLSRYSTEPSTDGSFPRTSDVAVVGRGKEDVILRYDNATNSSEIQLRAGIRSYPTNSGNPNIIGNIIFNDVDPAYIQLKRMSGLATKPKQGANSVINMVADKINIISNFDSDVKDKISGRKDLISEDEGNMDSIMENLHQVPKGDKLVELLNIMKGCLLNHTHGWAGESESGDWAGYLNSLKDYTIEDILSEHVRIS